MLFNPSISTCDWPYNVQCNIKINKIQPRLPDVAAKETKIQNWQTNFFQRRQTLRPFKIVPVTEQKTVRTQGSSTSQKTSNSMGTVKKKIPPNKITPKLVPISPKDNSQSNIQKSGTSKIKNMANKSKAIQSVVVSKSHTKPEFNLQKIGNPKTKYSQKVTQMIYKSTCIKPTGQFPYEKDCSKFINCWKWRATLQSCQSGLLFDASTGTCNWPHLAVCGTVTQLEEDPGAEQVQKIPPSGQKIRLYKGNSYAAGYFQVFVGDEWLYVVIESKSWNLKSHICQQMGYTRGALSETRGKHYGEISTHETATHALQCQGTEVNITQCQKVKVSLQTLSRNLVGIRCKKNSASECPVGWHRWGSKCYYIETNQPVSHKTAKDKCVEKSSVLASVTTQAQNDFLSDLLKSYRKKEGYHTGGTLFNFQGDRIWIWQDLGIPRSAHLNYSNWWKGWTGNETTPHSGTSIECISLHKFFHSNLTNADASADYYFWKLGSCDDDLHYICEMNKLNIGCIEDRGQSYNGTASVTDSGAECLRWDQMGGGVFQGLRAHANLKENYCANPDNDNQPWCYVEAGTTEFCSIPRCPSSGVSTADESSCEAGKYTCSTGECIHREWLCDAKNDCPGGDDELPDKCPDYSGLFTVNPNHRMEGSEVETWLFATKTSCRIRCALSKNFICRSFNYNEASEKCILSNSNVASYGGLVSDPDWQYHERKKFSVDCSLSFNCSDSKCIPTNKVCDGHHDCKGHEDEKGCSGVDEFEIRLANGTQYNEGTVEVKVNGVWGKVCHDMWDMEEAHVVCRQLGFKRGAKIRTTNSFFGEGEGTYLIDDLNCQGDEDSLALCDSAGWGQSDCSFSETAGAVCLLDDEECPEHQWECDNGQCILFEYYCDGIFDCLDKSDEKKEHCESPIELKVVASNETLLKAASDEEIGRVEILYKGLWGTICDDDVTIKEGNVICKMLGYTGAISVYGNNTFGPGSGPIWLDGLRCLGIERSVQDCHHQPWGENNCDHQEDLGVHCTSQSLPPPSRIERLSNSVPEVAGEVNLPTECGHRFVEDDPKEILASPRLIEGFVPRAGAHPWMAAIRRKKTAGLNVHHCGAFIVSTDFVLTAAHCVISYPVSDYFLRTGDFDNGEIDAFEEEWEVDEIVAHEHYDKDVYFNNDLAILKIKRKNGQGIQFNQRVQPLCLISHDWSYPAWHNCTVAGWGTTSSIGRSRLLLSTTLPIMLDSVCRSEHVYRPEDLSDGMFCAGHLEGGVDTCQGDSGGPLVCPINGRHTAVGIISWGHGCAKANKPGVYTKLSQYTEWILNRINKLDN